MQKLGGEHPWTIQLLLTMLFSCIPLGGFERAESIARYILAIAERQLTPDAATVKQWRDLCTFLQRPAGVLRMGRKIWGILPGVARQAPADLFPPAAPVAYEELDSMESLDAARRLNMLSWRDARQENYAIAELFGSSALAVHGEKLGSEHPQTIKCQGFQAFRFEPPGRYDSAESLSQRILTLHMRTLSVGHPETVKSLLNLAGVSLLQGDAARATATCDQILLLDPHNADAYRYRSTAALARHDFASALVDVDQALLLAPHNARLYQQRGNVSCSAGVCPGYR